MIKTEKYFLERASYDNKNSFHKFASYDTLKEAKKVFNDLYKNKGCRIVKVTTETKVEVER